MTTLALAIALIVAQSPMVIIQQADAADWSITYYNMDPTNFVWSIQSSTNLTDTNWVDEPVTTDGTNMGVSRNGRSPFFWRLKGTPIQ